MNIPTGLILYQGNEGWYYYRYGSTLRTVSKRAFNYECAFVDDLEIKIKPYDYGSSDYHLLPLNLMQWSNK